MRGGLCHIHEGILTLRSVRPHRRVHYGPRWGTRSHRGRAKSGTTRADRPRETLPRRGLRRHSVRTGPAGHRSVIRVRHIGAQDPMAAAGAIDTPRRARTPQSLPSDRRTARPSRRPPQLNLTTQQHRRPAASPDSSRDPECHTPLASPALHCFDCAKQGASPRWLELRWRTKISSLRAAAFARTAARASLTAASADVQSGARPDVATTPPCGGSGRGKGPWKSG